jgi:apolipoprotein N-acyltransferase
MESRLDRPRATLVCALALGLAGAGFYFGTGLAPSAWLIWLAPLPVLLLAPRVSAWAAALVAGGAWLIGEGNEWTYLTGEVGITAARTGRLFVAAAVLFALATLLFRGLVLRGRWIAATLAVPVFWVGAEYLFSVLLPDGAFWSIAYTQADVHPLIQLASVTGYWGITFLILLVPGALAVMSLRGMTGPHRIRVGAAVAVLLVAVLGFGVVRLASAGPSGPTARVALVAQGGDSDRIDVSTATGQALLAGYLAETRRATAAGASIVVLPEMVFRADSASLPGITGPFAALARETGATIVLGVGSVDSAVRRPDGAVTGYNTAQIFTADGAVTVYRKQHLLVTEPYLAGDAMVFVPGTDAALGVVICKDLDFPTLARDYRRSGAQLMLVPAWDYDDDGWLHSRMAVVRGIENGIPVARSARMGELTISDAQGRMIANSRTGTTPFVATAAVLTVGGESTVYTLLGPWFAWLCLALLLGSLVRLFRRRPAPAGPATEEAEVPTPVAVGA